YMEKYTQLTARNAPDQIRSQGEPKRAASPSSTPKTAVIIGLRTKRYGPATTSCRVASQAASVPCPIRANSRTVQDHNANPPAISATPTSTGRTAPPPS